MRSFHLLLMVAALSGTAAPVAAAEKAPGEAEFDRTIAPLLTRYCGDCHARDTRQKRWSFDAYAGYAELVADQAAWRKAEQFLKNRLMPPAGEAAPTDAQRNTLLDWIDRTVFYVDPRRPDPGRTTLRRLNRAEYDNTLRDVLAVESRLSEQFPPDDAGYGFDNIGDVLTLSPLHLEKYSAAARQAAAEAVRLSPPFRLGVDLPPDRLTVFAGKPELLDGAMLLRDPADEVGAVVDVALPSTYRILARLAVAGGEKPADRPRVDVLLAGEKIAELAPTTPWAGRVGFFPGSSAYIELPAGNHRLSLRMTKPAARQSVAAKPAEASAKPAEETKPAVGQEPVAAIGFYELSGPFTPLPPRPSAFLRREFGAQPLGRPILYLSGEDLNAGTGRSGTDTGRIWFASNGFRRGPLILHDAGRYRVRLKVGAQQVGPEQARFEIRTAGRTFGPFAVTAGSQAEQWVDFECELPAGEHDWQVWFVNEYKDPKTGEERWFWLHEFSIEGPLGAPAGPSRDQVLEVLHRTARRLFRRAPAHEELARLDRIAAAAERAGYDPPSTLRFGIEALLISPKFLFHPQPSPTRPSAADSVAAGSVPIDEITLASRLSYFLWSSAPDEELLALAEQGKLRSRLTEQVTRLLADPRSAALTANFAGQWLQLRNLELAAPDREEFPEFDARLATDFRRETELLFEHILRRNRPVIEFLDADYTFINARLAAHYGLPAPSSDTVSDAAGDAPGDEFRRLSLAGTPRRGVLTHAGILTITSHPTRTAPVKRGKWILEQILGITPPPPPRDVPPLPEIREDETQPLRVRLERHRADAACASCHALLDPPGFALETFDAVGRLRSRDGEHPIDAGGRLITGERFADWTEFQRLLVTRRRDDFVRCLTEHLLTYALGRGLTYRDKTTIRELATQAAAPEFGFQDLIQAVCRSVPFQRMRVESEPSSAR